MPIFLAAAAVLLMLAVTLGHQLRADARRDSLGLRAARAEIVADLHHRAAQVRNRDLVSLRLSRSLITGRSPLDVFHDEDR